MAKRIRPSSTDLDGKAIDQDPYGGSELRIERTRQPGVGINRLVEPESLMLAQPGEAAAEPLWEQLGTNESIEASAVERRLICRGPLPIHVRLR